MQPPPPSDQVPPPTSPSAGVTVYLGLGSNLGDRLAYLRRARAELEARGVLRETELSPIYETDAVADEPQPPYLNAVVRGETALSAAQLLAATAAIERALGRVRPPHQSPRAKAPRTVDIDVLLYGDRIIHTATLSVPHPALLERAFVRVPLADVARPGLLHPRTGTMLTTAAPSDLVRRFSGG